MNDKSLLRSPITVIMFNARKHIFDHLGLKYKNPKTYMPVSTVNTSRRYNKQ